MKIHAICTDIDGTLLDSRRELSSRTVAAIKKLDKKIPVILASSRMPAAMRHLQKELDILDHPMICYNGAYVIYYTSSSVQVLDSVTIPVSLCESIVGLTQGTAIHVSLYNDDNWYAQAHDQWTERESRITKVNPQIVPFENVLSTWRTNRAGAHKIMCMGIESEIMHLAGLLREKYANDIHVYPSKSTYLEIAPRSISKASALALLMSRQYGMDLSAVLSFGDNFNDVELIQRSGFGIALGNAKDAVKAVAREVTLTNIEDGVAIVLEKYAPMCEPPTGKSNV